MTQADGGGFSGRSGVAVVTGGSGGIGAAICTLLAERGSDVAFTYRRNETAAADVGAAVEASGRRATSSRVDVTDPDAVKAFADAAAEEFGGIHTAISAAGPYVPMRYVSQIDPELFREKIEADLFGAFHLVWAVLPHLRLSGGNIVAVTSMAVRRYPPKDSLSAVPKGGVEALIRAVAAEEGRFGIRANSVGPGLMAAGMYHELVARGDFTEELLADASANIALGRPGTAEDIAEAVCFLASDRASYITGKVLDADGGYKI
jgi:NAD(P)-dependent dehydrogenase (short-subunit alcohol dehydrogenase family)